MWLSAWGNTTVTAKGSERVIKEWQRGREKGWKRKRGREWDEEGRNGREGLEWDGWEMDRAVRRGERILEWVHGGGGHLQLRGNLFLPFSPNKRPDWLCCVRTDLLHAGIKKKKKLIHSKVTTTAGCRNIFSQLDRQKSVLYYASHSVTCK